MGWWTWQGRGRSLAAPRQPPLHRARPRSWPRARPRSLRPRAFGHRQRIPSRRATSWTASGDGGRCDLHALPFDQYGRHRDARDVAELVRALEGPTRLAVLDVGATPASAALPARRLGRRRRPERGRLRRGARCRLLARLGPGAALSGRELRPGALAGQPGARARGRSPTLPGRATARGAALRAAAGAVRPPETERAEALLFEYVKLALHAEHRSFASTATAACPTSPRHWRRSATGGAACHAFPSGYLYHWLPLMLLKHHLLGLDPRADVHQALDRWYNAREADADRCLPAYRWGVLVSKAGETAVLQTAADRFAVRPPDAARRPGRAAGRPARAEPAGAGARQPSARGGGGAAGAPGAPDHRAHARGRDLRAHLAAIRRGRVMRLLNAVQPPAGPRRALTAHDFIPSQARESSAGAGHSRRDAGVTPTMPPDPGPAQRPAHGTAKSSA